MSGMISNKTEREGLQDDERTAVTCGLDTVIV